MLLFVFLPNPSGSFKLVGSICAWQAFYPTGCHMSSSLRNLHSQNTCQYFCGFAPIGPSHAENVCTRSFLWYCGVKAGGGGWSRGCKELDMRTRTAWSRQGWWAHNTAAALLIRWSTHHPPSVAGKFLLTIETEYKDIKCSGRCACKASTHS